MDLATCNILHQAWFSTTHGHTCPSRFDFRGADEVVGSVPSVGGACLGCCYGGKICPVWVGRGKFDDMCHVRW